MRIGFNGAPRTTNESQSGTQAAIDAHFNATVTAAYSGHENPYAVTPGFAVQDEVLMSPTAARQQDFSAPPERKSLFKRGIDKLNELRNPKYPRGARLISSLTAVAGITAATMGFPSAHAENTIQQTTGAVTSQQFEDVPINPNLIQPEEGDTTVIVGSSGNGAAIPLTTGVGEVMNGVGGPNKPFTAVGPEYPGEVLKVGAKIGMGMGTHSYGESLELGVQGAVEYMNSHDSQNAAGYSQGAHAIELAGIQVALENPDKQYIINVGGSPLTPGGLADLVKGTPAEAVMAAAGFSLRQEELPPNVTIVYHAVENDPYANPTLNLPTGLMAHYGNAYFPDQFRTDEIEVYTMPNGAKKIVKRMRYSTEEAFGLVPMRAQGVPKVTIMNQAPGVYTDIPNFNDPNVATVTETLTTGVDQAEAAGVITAEQGAQVEQAVVDAATYVDDETTRITEEVNTALEATNDQVVAVQQQITNDYEAAVANTQQTFEDAQAQIKAQIEDFAAVNGITLPQ